MTTVHKTVTNGETQSLLQLLFGIIDKPTATFEAAVARRKWWMWLVPLLLVILATAVLLAVQLPYNMEMGREQAEARLASMPAEQAEAARSSMETFLSPQFLLASGLGSIVVILFIAVLVQTAFLYYTALVAGGDDMSFGSMFTMSAWSRLPAAIGALAQAGFIAFTGRNIQYLGLAALVTTGDPMQDVQDPMVMLLARIDLFWLWHLLLVTLGLAVVARFSRGKSLIITLLYAVLALGTSVLPTLLFGGVFGG